MSRANESRFRRMWADLRAIGDPAAVYEDLVSAYGDPRRRYHTLEHVGRTLCELDAAESCADRAAAELALWFHDVAYDPRRGDNEEASARHLEGVGAAARIPRSRVDRAAAHVRATAHADISLWDRDTATVLDCDLAILAAPRALFDRYDAQIREEYAWVPEAEYRRRRADVLRGFLARPRIFRTAAFDCYEAPARDNLMLALSRVEAA